MLRLAVKVALKSGHFVARDAQYPVACFDAQRVCQQYLKFLTKDNIKKMLETEWHQLQDFKRNTNVNADVASILDCSGEMLQMLS